MKRICFFLMSGLPIPAVHGGAIETLVQILIDENEKCGRYHFVVLCTHDVKAESISKAYQYTEFVYFKQYPFMDKIMSFLSRGLYRVFRVAVPFSVGCIQALKHVRKSKCDLLVNETWKVYISPLLARVFCKDKIALHIHRKGEPEKGDISKRIDNSFGSLIAVSSFVAEDWKKNTARKHSDTYVLMNCCDSKAMRKSVSEAEKRELKQRLGIANEERIVIFTGRVTNEKGVMELVQAIDKVTAKAVCLLIVGGSIGQKKTAYEINLDQRIAQSNKHIVRTGYVDNCELYKYYSIADVTVLPSTCEEAAALTVIESMTAGTPLITTNRGGIPEYATKDEAVVVDVDEQLIPCLAYEIERLLEDDELRTELAKKAQERSEAYSPEKYYQAFSEIIQQID